MFHNLSFVPAKQNSTLLYGIFAYFTQRGEVGYSNEDFFVALRDM
jgi:hypothetical protein